MSKAALPADTPDARVVVGPLLRFVDSREATIWVETDRPCVVSVQCGRVSGTERTWGVHGHHYALVVLEGLQPATQQPYTVALDGAQVWPTPGAADSLIRTAAPEDELRLAFGSCRRGEGQTKPDIANVGADALKAMADRMGGLEPAQWPHALLMLGDQVYADDPSDAIQQRLARRRASGQGPSGPDEGPQQVVREICDFEEYTWLYHESWTDDQVRWLLSTVPTCMILDDHDLRDDWNSSWSWRQQIVTEPWWRERVVGAFSSYWVYQHLGNLSPGELAEDELYRAVRTAADDAERERLLADFSWRADVEPDTARWSYHRDFGDVRLIMVDSRCSRTLDPDRRAMVDAREWAWVRQQALGELPSGAPIRHLLIGTSLPFLMMPGLHHLEGWNEAIAQGARGRRLAKLGEKLRLALDLEHWAAFRRSFAAMTELAGEIARGPRPPASVLWLSGDVHCSYLAEAEVDGVDHGVTAMHQLTMSPFRNPLNLPIRMVNRLVKRPGVVRVLRALASTAGVKEPPIRWAVPDGPWFDNGVMTLVLRAREATVEVEHAHVRDDGEQVLRCTTVRALTGPAVRGRTQ